MRGLLALSFALLVVANTVSSGAIYRRYRELAVPEGAINSEAQPAETYVSELRKDQIPVQVVEVIEPVLLVKPVENLRSVEPELAIPETASAALMTNEIIPEKLEKLEENLETVKAIERAVVKEQELQQPLSEPVIALVEQGQQQLRKIESEVPAGPVVLVEEAIISQQKEDLPIAQNAEKQNLGYERSENLPENLPQQPLLPQLLVEEKKTEEIKLVEAEKPQLKTIKEEALIAENTPEVQPAKEAILLPVASVEKQSELNSLEENVAPAEIQPELKVLKEEEPLNETPKLEESVKQEKEELLEKKKEEGRSEKKEEKIEEIEEKEIEIIKEEIIKQAIENRIKEEIKEVIQKKIPAEKQESPKELEDIVPSAKQAPAADAGPTTARPNQPGFIQQLVQNSPLGQLLNNFNGANQANPEQNTPVATAATFLQALQNTTAQITNNIQQGFQQQLQSLQTTFTGQQPQQAAVASDAAAPAATPRPQGPIQSVLNNFLGNSAQPQQQAAPAATTQQPAGPLQGIFNLFGGNRVPSASPSSSTPAAVPQPPKEEAEPAPSEPAAPVEIARDSVEISDEVVKPDEIVVSDDESHE